MTKEPRSESEYGERQSEATRRVLIDIGQMLAAFTDCIVVVGGWTPDLLFQDTESSHVGSMDVDRAVDAERLQDGRYAELLQLLLDTRRYRLGVKAFQIVVDVDLFGGPQRASWRRSGGFPCHESRVICTTGIQSALSEL